MELEHLLKSYEWYDHPEGLKFVETHRDGHRTSGLWLMLPSAMSAFHRVLDSEEIWFIHKGRLRLHWLDPQAGLVSRVLGTELELGEEPVISIPMGAWQAAEPVQGEAFALGSVVCAPAFQFSKFEIATRDQLLEQHPQYPDIIRRLTLPNNGPL